MNNVMAWEKWDEGDFFNEELSDEEINDFEKRLVVDTFLFP